MVKTQNMNLKIKELVEVTKDVIKDCSVENGAIVAANTDMEYYPKDVSSYRYVWPRDASFICVAADILDIEIQEKFFRWCLKRAEDFEEEEVFYQRYDTNGLKEGDRFQPDQTGSVLWAVWHHYKDRLEDALDFKELIEMGANGLCAKWNGSHFSVPTYDIWEEKSTLPEVKDNHTYSLAACAKGLRCANEIIKDKNWVKVADEMEKQIRKAYKARKGYFFKTVGKINDEIVDSSILGLVYPFEIFKPTDDRIRRSIEIIEKRLVKKNGGVHRYEFDTYDGWTPNGKVISLGAGFWPLLNFWMSIVLNRMGEKEKAMKYYRKVMDSVDKYIPEQIFDNVFQKSVSPLCWSHAMFVLATKELGLI